MRLVASGRVVQKAVLQRHARTRRDSLYRIGYDRCERGQPLARKGDPAFPPLLFAAVYGTHQLFPRKIGRIFPIKSAHTRGTEAPDLDRSMVGRPKVVVDPEGIRLQGARIDRRRFRRIAAQVFPVPAKGVPGPLAARPDKVLQFHAADGAVILRLHILAVTDSVGHLQGNGDPPFPKRFGGARRRGGLLPVHLRKGKAVFRRKPHGVAAARMPRHRFGILPRDLLVRKICTQTEFDHIPLAFFFYCNISSRPCKQFAENLSRIRKQAPMHCKLSACAHPPQRDRPPLSGLAIVCIPKGVSKRARAPHIGRPAIPVYRIGKGAFGWTEGSFDFVSKQFFTARSRRKFSLAVFRRRFLCRRT